MLFGAPAAQDDQGLKRELVRAFLSYLGVEQEKIDGDGN
jgi:hypothetical protein